ncbi:MAG: hypothetical protein JW869_06695 [Candidatus Omnitrophica bacterium]|nr:hypothetical protein [Candidatus Omnitrophota bacterium]
MKKPPALFSKISKREKSIIYVVIFMFSAVLLYILVVNPILSKIAALDGEIENQETRIEKNLRILSRKEVIEKEIDYYSSYVMRAKSEQQETVGFLQEMEEMANKSSLYVIDIKAAGLEEGELLNKYLIRLNCEAQIEQITNFFYDVESSKKLLRIEEYDLRPKTAGSSVIKCTITISKAVLP